MERKREIERSGKQMAHREGQREIHCTFIDTHTHNTHTHSHTCTHTTCTHTHTHTHTHTRTHAHTICAQWLLFSGASLFPPFFFFDHAQQASSVGVNSALVCAERVKG